MEKNQSFTDINVKFEEFLKLKKSEDSNVNKYVSRVNFCK